MNAELQKLLWEKYPSLFKQKDLPAHKTAMCWGLDVGDGWFGLIDTACSLIQEHIDRTPECHQVEFTQVKEKFGGLRMYTIGGDDFTEGVISMASSMSYCICEDCGLPGSETDTGWVLTLCESCKSERESRKNVT